jgi:hypothetical protein
MIRSQAVDPEAQAELLELLATASTLLSQIPMISDIVVEPDPAGLKLPVGTRQQFQVILLGADKEPISLTEFPSHATPYLTDVRVDPQMTEVVDLDPVALTFTLEPLMAGRANVELSLMLAPSIEPAQKEMIPMRHWFTLQQEEKCEIKITIDKPILVKNIDDDDLDETPDLEQKGPIKGKKNKKGSEDENNLGKLTIVAKGPQDAKVTLEKTKGGEKIRVWKDHLKTPGGEITFDGKDNVFPITKIPELFVEGIEGSDRMGDVELTATCCGNVSDSVKLTVLFVEITAKFKETDELAPDNAARFTYAERAAPFTFNLGRHLFVDRVGIGIELTGLVHPSDFTQEIILDRDAETKVYEDAKDGSTLRAYLKFSSPPPVRTLTQSGNDTSHPIMRDDDPQSGSSKGKIYDIDAPGTLTDIPKFVPKGTIVRIRSNYRQFARFEPQKERCSDIFKWSAAVSNKLTGKRSIVKVKSSTKNTLSVEGEPWKMNEWKDGTVFFGLWIKGRWKDVYGVIESNTKDTITVTRDWEVKPPKGIKVLLTAHDAWTEEKRFNDVGDNRIKIDKPIELTFDLE